MESPLTRISHHVDAAPSLDDRLRDDAELEAAAVAARTAGDFERAATLFSLAATFTPDVRRRLHLRLRQASCHAAADDRAAAIALAGEVAAQARADHLHRELADALCAIVDDHIQHDRLAEATRLLAEALYELERLPPDDVDFTVLHDIAVALTRCGFPAVALSLHERSLERATNDEDRALAYARSACAAHAAARTEEDARHRDQLVHDGLYAATAALDPRSGAGVHARVTARAHRSVLLAMIGHHEAALDDAVHARVEADELGLREERLVAMIGEAVARWHLHADPDVVRLIDEVRVLAAEIGAREHVSAVDDVETAALWSANRFTAMRTVLERRLSAAEVELRRERSARWQHVKLGIEHHKIEAISETDPLTGLHNRRFLGHSLPATLEDHGPVCVAVVDVDGFKHVNDDFTYAHGDRVLQEMATTFERMCRRGDSVVRLGGDEFVLVLRETSPGDARMVLDRLRLHIAARTWPGLPSTFRLTASIGVAVGSGALDATRVLQDASDALRTSKREGRNRITFR